MNWRSGLLVFGLSAGGLLCVNAQVPAGSVVSNSTPGLAPVHVVPAPPQFTPPPLATHQPPPQPPGLGPAPKAPLDDFIAFDAQEKEVSVVNGTAQAMFSFNITNISAAPVTISYVQTSCGCTVAKLPSTPWVLGPKDHGEISATMQLAGTPPGGTKIKTLTVNSDKGNKALYVKATILPEPAPMTQMDRTNNIKMATADRQAVFKGDCVRCHVTPAKDAMGHDKVGQDLYTAVCGVCHEAEHQASFVPNLHHLPEPTSAEFWRNWIMHGKPGSLMPAFAQSEGGILNNQQIDSLVQYLSTIIPPHPVTVTTPTAKAQ